MCSREPSMGDVDSVCLPGPLQPLPCCTHVRTGEATHIEVGIWQGAFPLLNLAPHATLQSSLLPSSQALGVRHCCVIPWTLKQLRNVSEKEGADSDCVPRDFLTPVHRLEEKLLARLAVFLGHCHLGGSRVP